MNKDRPLKVALEFYAKMVNLQVNIYDYDYDYKWLWMTLLTVFFRLQCAGFIMMESVF